MAQQKQEKVALTTGIGTIGFPCLFKETAREKDDGTKSYEVQIIIPKSQREDVRALLKAIKTVGEAKWGSKWKQVRTPLRDGDAEADELTEDGSTKGEKYPERLGAYFLNARSTKPVGVYDRDRSLITDASDVYAGCKGKINVTFFAYSVSGNHGIAAGLNGVQKIADGEPIGGTGAPTVESMFDILDDEDDLDLDEDDDLDGDEEDEDEALAPKKKAKKKAPAKKAKKKAEPEPDEDDDDDLDDEDDDDL